MADYTLEILTTNYSGQTADITFYPCSGGTINLGSQVLPYNYVSDYVYGNYDLSFSAYGTTCSFTVPCPSPTPTPTNTATVTPTPEVTTTPTVTPTPTTPFTLKVESANSGVTIQSLTQIGDLITFTFTQGSFPVTNGAVYGTHSSSPTLGGAQVTLTFDSTVSSTFTITKNGTEIVNFPSGPGLNQQYQIGTQFSNLQSTDVMILKFQ